MIAARSEVPQDMNHGGRDEWESSRDNSLSPQQNQNRSRREPESNSPNSRDIEPSFPTGGFSYAPQPMDTDSPASYPKHVIVPSPADSNDSRQYRIPDGAPMPYKYPAVSQYSDSPSTSSGGEKVVTPIVNHEPMPMNQGGYDGPQYRPPPQGHFYPSDAYGRPYGPPTPPHGDMMNYGPPPPSPMQNGVPPKRWACDFCGIAAFRTYEEACSHEQGCPRRQAAYNARNGPPPPQQYPNQQQYQQQPQYSQPPPYPHQQQQHSPVVGGLGALYHATQEVGAVYQGGRPQWNGPPMPSEHTGGYPPLSPRFNDFRSYEHRDEAAKYQNSQGPRMLLAMPSDTESLSDRQCYVRSEMVEVFAATEKDVSARHSKGAQKLAEGQVGIRCVHCSHLRPKDRAERAVCYPSSISRIYQTVADMQRFHFEQCREIPENVRAVYKSLKTTRPRGVGSPQTYWVQSAKILGMIDSEEGIRFSSDNENKNKNDDEVDEKEEQEQATN